MARRCAPFALLLTVLPLQGAAPDFGIDLEQRLAAKLPAFALSAPPFVLPPLALQRQPDGRIRYLDFGPGCHFSLPDFPPEAEGLIDLFGGSENFVTAAFAQRVRLFHRDTPPRSDENTRAPLTELPLAAEDAAVLRALLTFDASYSWYSRDEVYECAPDYTHRVEFSASGRSIAVDLCLGCHTARMVDGDREIQSANIEFIAEQLQALLAHSASRARAQR